MTALILRDEVPPDDAVVVIRGGLHSLDPDRVRATAQDSFIEIGVYGVSVFRRPRRRCAGAVRADQPSAESGGDLGRPVWRPPAAGFSLLATDASPHFDVVLPDLTVGTLAALVWCFESRPNPLKEDL